LNEARPKTLTPSAGYIPAQGEKKMTPFYRRTILALITVFFAIPAALSAQQAPQPQSQPGQQAGGSNQGKARMGRQQGGDLIKNLNLSADQKKQFQQMRLESMQRAKAIRADNSLSQTDRKQKLRELHKQTMNKVMAILTPEQKEQLKKTLEERRKNRSKNRSKEDSDN
jgi:Spy/CpxP family protein refolding chaperone